ncbi:ABC transporter permease [Natronobeatus ordinarius]|uniref:ABC transporter permease n=1 Tax=Natronobeatus ordinarius TaxID=2963433 RepID=UPI0020CE1022|nr:ABC transporter permease [Natronobeatus ordinarius]
MTAERDSRSRPVTWALMDRAIAVKERLPRAVYQSPPNWLGYLLLVPALVLVGFLFVGMLMLARYSVLTFDPIELLVYEYTLENWRRLLTTSGYHTIFLRTFVLTTIVTVLSVALALPYAYLTIRVRSPLVRKVLLVSIFVPFFTGVIVRAYGWLIVLGRDGLVNAALGVVGVGPVRFLGSEFAVLIGLLQIMLPFAIIMIAPSIQHIDRSLELAASNLGADRLQTFRHVVVPLAAPGIAGATIVVFTITAATFAIPDLIGGGRVDFVANLVYRTLFNSANYPLAATLSVALVVLTSLVVLAVFRLRGSGTLGIDGGETDD